MTKPGKPYQSGWKSDEQIVVDVLDSFHDGQREKKARAILAALRKNHRMLVNR